MMYLMTKHLPLFLGFLLLTACAPSDEAKIKQAIAEANYCETAADCVDVGAKCPFDCYIFVHKNEAERIKAMVDGYQSTCAYSCMAMTGVECIAKKCQVTTDMPAAAEEAAPLDNRDGNVGAACTSDSECQTPMDYLVRSSCPFTSQCIDNACAVVCPMLEDDQTPQLSEHRPARCSVDSDCDCGAYAATDATACTCVSNECVAVVAR